VATFLITLVPKKESEPIKKKRQKGTIQPGKEGREEF
jgi:hypothetical protein